MEDETTGTSDWVDRLFVYDGGGSVRALTDLEGNITDTFSYDAFGVSLTGADSRAVGGEEEIGRAPESLAPQAGFLRDASLRSRRGLRSLGVTLAIPTSGIHPPLGNESPRL